MAYANPYQEGMAKGFGTVGFIGGGIAAGVGMHSAIRPMGQWATNTPRALGALIGTVEMGAESGMRAMGEVSTNVAMGTEGLIRGKFARRSVIGGAALLGAAGVGLAAKGVATAAYDPNRGPVGRMFGATTYGAIGGGILGAASAGFNFVSDWRKNMPSGTDIGNQIYESASSKFDALAEARGHRRFIEPTAQDITSRKALDLVDPTHAPRRIDKATGDIFESEAAWLAAQKQNLKSQAAEAGHIAAAKIGGKYPMSAEGMSGLWKAAKGKGLWGLGIGAVAGLAIGVHGAVTAGSGRRRDMIQSNAPMY